MRRPPALILISGLVAFLAFCPARPAGAACNAAPGQSAHQTFYTNNTLAYCADGENWTPVATSGQPVVFYAIRSAGHVASPATIVFNTEQIDTASSYNPATGIFTAPQAGIYQFHWGSIGNTLNDVYRLNLMKNGVIAGVAQNRIDTIANSPGEQDYSEGTATAYLALAQGDAISVYFEADAGSALYGTHAFTYFGGHLVSGGLGGGGGTALPSGAIMAFDLDSCPAGWSEYAPSSGRFLRGRCLSGQPCNDPDGTRAAGSTQDDELKSHAHNIGLSSGTSFGGGGVAAANNNSAGGTSSNRAFATGGAETRPKNVAVLYCRKD